MVIDCCTLNKQTCMMYHFNQNVTADAKRYHTCLYVECTMIYDHICTQFLKTILDAVLQSYQLRRSNCVILDVTESGIFEKRLN